MLCLPWHQILLPQHFSGATEKAADGSSLWLRSQTSLQRDSFQEALLKTIRLTSAVPLYKIHKQQHG